MAMLVRLKPYEPKRGCVLQRYTYKGKKFEASKGWYKVDDAIANYLAKVHQVPGDDSTPLAFEVKTEKEAKAIHEAETKKALASDKAPPENPLDARDVTTEGGTAESTESSKEGGDLTTEDLKKGTSREKNRPATAK